MYLMSIILPCYNESKSLYELYKKASYITSNYDIEIIFLDNGSIDNSWEIMNGFEKTKDIKFLKLDNNKGYGFGLKYALKYCDGEYIGWTHADLQTDLFDVIKAYKLINILKNKGYKNNLAVKGIRLGRDFQEKFTSFVFDIIANLIFLSSNIREINAQPSIYQKSLIKNLLNSPDNYNFDLFAYLSARSRRFEFHRISVLFPKRIFGESHWNKGIIAKIKFVITSLNGLISYRFKIKIDKF